jgi:cell division transport system permease protein
MRANFVWSGVATGMRRNLAMTIALILNTTIALGAIGAALLARTEISRFRSTYENKINVSVYLCATEFQPPCKAKTSDAQIAAIKAAIDSDPTVRGESFISEDEAYIRGKQQQPNVAKFLKPGVLPASFEVKLRDLQKDFPAFEAKFAAMPGVGQVSNLLDTFSTVLNIINDVRIIILVIAVIVLVASALVMATTIQVAATQRRTETSIMRLVGASRWMTELPFMLEAVIDTVIGGIIGVVLIGVGKVYVLDNIFSGPTRHGVIPDLSMDDVLKAGGAGLGIGILLAAVTAFTTLRFYVRL